MLMPKPTLQDGGMTKYTPGVVAPKTGPVGQPVTPMAINPATEAEIKRKAEAGIGLSAPTKEKQAMYDNYRTQFVNNRQAKAFAPVDMNQYKVQSATIDDIAKKYGFDFSRDYANRQAEAEAQARRNANADASRKNQSNRDLNLKAIDNNLMSQAEGLDRNYFQQYQQQAQAQVNGGINGGIAADQDLRMSMARQAAMSDSYRDANLGRMQENQRFTNDDIRLAEDLGLINQQGLARAESLHQDRLMQGAGLAMDTDRFNLDQNQGLMNAALSQRGQNIGIEQWIQEMDRMKSRDARADWEYGDTRAYNAGRDKVADSQWAKEFGLQKDEFGWRKATDTRDFNYGVGRDKVADGQWNKQFGLETSKFDWSKYMDGQNLGLSRQRLAQDGKALSQQMPKITSAEEYLKMILGEMDYDIYAKMNQASPKLDPTAKTGIASQPGSYWWARGYGDQYLPK